ncbi:unnamed protein product [Didymodactylos carnosus]|uniref:Uncharacterized protein n=1 Tax=Didymodactylos carnosus TaxID=1234261 RepID=A0A814J6T2_9BILA|nr:unnamed protein product [Didymodactylos carnosus]CAF1285798.1 unnamed protein product [Didymodactylos carnosus]CAF3804125.1 unnamed protein product [Didymodactylos carnosus]CAF4090794.1 unnamed protein product [Didymodactylos carnosus]
MIRHVYSLCLNYPRTMSSSLIRGTAITTTTAAREDVDTTSKIDSDTYSNDSNKKASSERTGLKSTAVALSAATITVIAYAIYHLKFHRRFDNSAPLINQHPAVDKIVDSLTERNNSETKTQVTVKMPDTATFKARLLTEYERSKLIFLPDGIQEPAPKLDIHLEDKVELERPKEIHETDALKFEEKFLRAYLLIGVVYPMFILALAIKKYVYINLYLKENRDPLKKRLFLLEAKIEPNKDIEYIKYYKDRLRTQILLLCLSPLSYFIFKYRRILFKHWYKQDETFAAIQES